MCNGCGMAYSFYFGIQFHRVDCSMVANPNPELNDLKVEIVRPGADEWLKEIIRRGG